MKSSSLSGNFLFCSAVTFVVFVNQYFINAAPSKKRFIQKSYRLFHLSSSFFLSLLAGPSLQDQAMLWVHAWFLHHIYTHAHRQGIILHNCSPNTRCCCSDPILATFDIYALQLCCLKKPHITLRFESDWQTYHKARETFTMCMK